jgi:rhodanese-related sulfurtransferase
VIGQPSADDRWRAIAPRAGRDLESRAVLVDPAEVVALRSDLTLAVRVLEVRAEADFNLFHLVGSRRITLDETRGPTLARELTGLPENHILFLASNGERDAAEAWRRLKAQGVINLYVIEGGVNGWLAAYPPSPDVARRAEAPDDETLGWRFVAAVGERIPSADPEEPARDYARKVVLQRKVLAKGGCG